MFYCNFIAIACLRWIGHVARMPDDCIPKARFFWKTGDWQTFGWCTMQALQRHNPQMEAHHPTWLSVL